MITVLAGGVGGARFLEGLLQIVEPAEVTVVVNTGDDMNLYGLHVAPDFDTVLYTLGGGSNTATGWGLAGESWTTIEALKRYGGPTWFRLGDRDLATHLYRTGRLADGAALSAVTAEIARAWGVGARILPMSDDRVRTKIELGSGEEVEFQEYFVHLRHEVPVRALRYEGAAEAEPAPGVLEALREAEVVVFAPSNPYLSILPILALPAIAGVVAGRRLSVVAISPIVNGTALKGPADRLLVELGGSASPEGVAQLLAPFIGALVLDEQDAAHGEAVAAEGVHPVLTDTVMREPVIAAELARVALAAGRAKVFEQ